MWFSPGARAGPILSSLRETVARGGDGHHTCCDTELGDEFLFPSCPRPPPAPGSGHGGWRDSDGDGDLLARSWGDSGPPGPTRHGHSRPFEVVLFTWHLHLAALFIDALAPVSDS